MKKEVIILFVLMFAMSSILAVQTGNSSQENETPPYVGGCGTVHPNTIENKNLCCQNSGYDKWDSNLKKCISEGNSEEETICCKMFGYGAYMEEVNVEYELMKQSECAVSEEFVGGGREIVENKFCKKTLTPGQVGEIIRVRNRLRVHTNQSECPEDCTCAGSTTKCQFQNGTREMTVHAGSSGNIIVQVKNTNASTQVQLYKSEGKVYGVFRNNETKEIILPDEVEEKIRERKQKRWEEHNITLDEDGYYRVQSKKKARLFWVIPVKERVRTRLDAETGEIIRTRTSWWGFLARDVRDESEE